MLIYDEMELDILRLALRNEGRVVPERDISAANTDLLIAGAEESGYILTRHKNAWAVYRYDRGTVANLSFHAALRNAIDDFFNRHVGAGISLAMRAAWEEATGKSSNIFGVTSEQDIVLA